MLQAENGEVRTVHAAQVTATAFLGSDDVRGVVSLGIEGGRKGQDFGGTEFHAEATGFAALDDDVDASLSQVNPHGVKE